MYQFFVILCLNRIDFTLEFPRPLMPNIVLVGGINCNVRNPLPEVRPFFLTSCSLDTMRAMQEDLLFVYLLILLQDLQPWVSGEHGFVVFTLGSMVSDMPTETTSVFLEAFRQIPQKVKESL